MQGQRVHSLGCKEIVVSPLRGAPYKRRMIYMFTGSRSQDHVLGFINLLGLGTEKAENWNIMI